MIYGFLAAVLPVWVLLAPRDYLSTFMKVGTIALLAVVVTMRSLLQGQVDQAADAGIVQEVEEFRTFVDEGVRSEEHTSELQSRT